MVGLWLAEGDHKTSREIKFTNNNSELILFFHRALWKHFRPINPPRIYAYLPSPGTTFVGPVPGAVYRTYIDRRANVPYYIYRVSGVVLARRWKKVSREICASPSNYQGILQGFFAGEGNIKESKGYRTRVLRIAQGKRFLLLERILRHFGVTFTYEPAQRSYVISGRENLEKLWNLGVSEMHSKKHAKFEAMLASYKQHHYKRLSLGPRILDMLSSPLTTCEIAALINRGESRETQVLTELRRNNEIEMFKVRSSYYWVRIDRRCIVISSEKFKVLRTLSHPRRLFEIARVVGRTGKSVSKRLAEMKPLGLVEKVNSNWRRIEVAKRVIVK
jgi:hypothetical protein